MLQCEDAEEMEETEALAAALVDGIKTAMMDIPKITLAALADPVLTAVTELMV